MFSSPDNHKAVQKHATKTNQSRTPSWLVVKVDCKDFVYLKYSSSNLGRASGYFEGPD